MGEEVVVGEFAHPVLIDREELYLVKDGAPFLHARKAKGLNKFFSREILAFVPGIPSKKRNVVQHCFGQDSLVAVLRERFSTGAFRKFLMIIAENKREMGIQQHRQTERLLDEHLARGV